MKQMLTGIVLSGGKSSRMGKDKALIQWNQKTLLQNAVDILTPLCSEILISSSNPAHSAYKTILVPDELPQQAPLIGIYSCLKKSSSVYNIVLSCDMPFVTEKTLQTLIEYIDNFDLIIPSNNGQLELLCAIYSKNLIPVMEKKIADQNYSLHGLVQQSLHLIVPIPKNTPDTFTNLNHPEDLMNFNIE